MLEVPYTYWEGESGFLLGFLNEWPNRWTQGKDLAELEEMLADLYEIMMEEEAEIKLKRKSGVLKLEASTVLA
jgi:predicted RNase H-like HicB family nuclease